MATREDHGATHKQEDRQKISKTAIAAITGLISSRILSHIFFGSVTALTPQMNIAPTNSSKLAIKANKTAL